MRRALHEFYTRPESGPASHFRTSAHASPLFAEVIAALVVRAAAGIDDNEAIDVVDVGAGRGELLTGLLRALPGQVAGRVRATGVELAPRPSGLPDAIAWTDVLPERVCGLLVATEWLDNVPVDVAEVDDAGVARYVHVDRRGTERLGEPVDGPDAGWLARWWPLDGAPPGTRAEIGATRDAAWADAVRRVGVGGALAVDYGHVRDSRPRLGTLTGFRGGREVPPVPDGTCDITAHVALDSVHASLPVPTELLTQREALRRWGIDGARPDLGLATSDPAAYVRALGRASAAAELTDRAGLGDHRWLVTEIRCDFWSYQR